MKSEYSLNLNSHDVKYRFDLYPFIPEKFLKLACIYAVTRLRKQNDESVHDIIYIGETKNLKDRFIKHHKATCMNDMKVNHIAILREENKFFRENIESALIKAYNPPCND